MSPNFIAQIVCLKKDAYSKLTIPRASIATTPWPGPACMLTRRLGRTSPLSSLRPPCPRFRHCRRLGFHSYGPPRTLVGLRSSLRTLWVDRTLSASIRPPLSVTRRVSCASARRIPSNGSAFFSAAAPSLQLLASRCESPLILLMIHLHFGRWLDVALSWSLKMRAGEIVYETLACVRYHRHVSCGGFETWRRTSRWH